MLIYGDAACQPTVTLFVHFTNLLTARNYGKIPIVEIQINGSCDFRKDGGYQWY